MGISQQGAISTRLAEIEKEIEALDSERAFLKEAAEIPTSQTPVFLEGDRPSRKNKRKFEILRLVQSALGQPECYIYGGFRTRALYDEVVSYIQKKDSSVAFEINYATFRSHLTRFKQEGRIFYDENTHCWRVTESLPYEELPVYPREEDTR